MYTLDQAVSVPGFFFQISFPVDRIAPGVILLDWQMGIDIEIDANGLVLGIDQGNALRREAAGQRVPSKNSATVGSFTQDRKIVSRENLRCRR